MWHQAKYCTNEIAQVYAHNFQFKARSAALGHRAANKQKVNYKGIR